MHLVYFILVEYLAKAYTDVQGSYIVIAKVPYQPCSQLYCFVSYVKLHNVMRMHNNLVAACFEFCKVDKTGG